MFRTIGTGLSMACFALFSLAQVASAQTKVAIINLQKAVLESAEIKVASKALEAKFKPRQMELEKIQAELNLIQTQLQSGKVTPQQEAELTAKGQRRQRDMTRIQEDLQGDVERERNEILAKSSQKMQAVIKTLAEKNGWDVVVDVQTTIYFKPALEITAEALKAYDAANPAK